MHLYNGKTSASTVLNTGAPQGCVLSPLLFSLFTNNCTSHHSSVKLIKFADDTTLVGLITNADESAYREEVARLVAWGETNYLQLNTTKTKEMVVDLRRNKSTMNAVVVDSHAIERVTSFKFLGATISATLTWEAHCDALLKKAQQRLYFLRQLKRFGLRREILSQFYRSTIESILTFCLCVWFRGAPKQLRNRMQRVVKTAVRITGCDSLPTLEDIYCQRTIARSRKIVADPQHPAYHLFQLMPSGKRYRSIRARTTRFKNSFYPQAVTTLNEQ